MQDLERPLGLQEVEALGICKQSVPLIGHLYTQEIILVHICVKRARAMGRPVGLNSCKIPISASGIEPTTFRPKPTVMPRK